MAADTRARILDAAERRFAFGGLEGVSLREIAREAGVNSAAVHYYFGSREALVEAVVLRRMQPIHRRRRALLDALAERGETHDVRALIEVLVRPLAELVARRGRAGRAHVRLLARLYADRRQLAFDLSRRHFGDVHEELGERIAKALPELPVPVLARRFALCVQATLATLADPDAFEVARGAGAARASADAIARELVDFLAGGLCAPASALEAPREGPPAAARTPGPGASQADPAHPADPR